MTTAPQENRGGYRPTAPQNNTGVSSTGGAGSADGQPNRYISGGKYGEGKAMMEQQQGASMAQAATPSAGAAAPSPAMPQLQTLLDNIGGVAGPITAGIDFGPGPGSDAMPTNLSGDTRPDENAMIIKQYLPDLAYAASFSDAPDSFKRFVNYLSGK